MFRSLLLLIGSLLIGLMLIEGALRIFVPVRNVGPSFTRYDEEVGRRLKRSFKTTRITPEFTMELTTNSLGFRGPEPGSTQGRPILFLGDSFTLGYGVSDGLEFPVLVERLLSNRYEAGGISVINGGLGNNGNGRVLKFLRAEGRKHDPRLIVLQLMGNDFEDNQEENIFELSSNSELKALSIAPRNGANVLQEAVETVPGLSDLYLIGFARQVLEFLRDPQAISTSEADRKLVSKPAPSDQLTYRLVEEILRLSRAEGWPVFIFTIEIEGERLEKLKTIFGSFDSPWMAMPGHEARPDLYFPTDGHWNAAGHRYAAEAISNWLIANERVWRRKDESTF